MARRFKVRRGGKSGVVSDSADVKGGETHTWIDKGCSHAPQGISIPFVVSTSTTTCLLSPCELTSISYTTRVELAIFGVRTLSYLIRQLRYGLVFCDVVLHTFFCGLSLDLIS